MMSVTKIKQPTTMNFYAATQWLAKARGLKSMRQPFDPMFE
jgi:hypothetical protein